jgi:hypothetical protein
MNPRIGKRSHYNSLKVKSSLQAVEFIKRNTKKNISFKQEFLYLEDVKTALNIYHIELSLKWKIRMKELITGNYDRKELLINIDEAIDKDRHRLQKKFNITL